MLCSSECLKDEICYYFDFCKIGSFSSCYIYNDNLPILPLLVVDDKNVMNGEVSFKCLNLLFPNLVISSVSYTKKKRYFNFKFVLSNKTAYFYRKE